MGVDLNLDFNNSCVEEGKRCDDDDNKIWFVFVLILFVFLLSNLDEERFFFFFIFLRMWNGYFIVDWSFTLCKKLELWNWEKSRLLCWEEYLLINWDGWVIEIFWKVLKELGEGGEEEEYWEWEEEFEEDCE
jgi:hypothetical protein